MSITYRLAALGAALALLAAAGCSTAPTAPVLAPTACKMWVVRTGTAVVLRGLDAAICCAKGVPSRWRSAFCCRRAFTVSGTSGYGSGRGAAVRRFTGPLAMAKFLFCWGCFRSVISLPFCAILHP